MKPSFLWLSAVFTCGLSACGGSSSGGNSPYDGTWLNCSPDETLGTSVGILLTQNNGSYTTSTRQYSDIQCLVENAAVPAVDYQGAHSQGSEVTTASGQYAIEIDRTVPDGEGQAVTCYDILYVDGDRLYFGDKNATTDCSTAEKRPVYLDFVQVYFKQ